MLRNLGNKDTNRNETLFQSIEHLNVDDFFLYNIKVSMLKNTVFLWHFTRFALSLHACSDSHTIKTVLIRDNTKDSDAKDKQ